MIAEILIVPVSGAMEPAKAGAQYIARSLGAIGVKVRESVSLCSDGKKLGRAVSAALERSNVILIVGGLDRSVGFLSKSVIAGGLGLELNRDGACLEAIRAYCRRTGEPFSPGDEEYADLPDGALAFPPSYGKAPGFAISSASQHIVLLPEHIQELAAMWERYAAPYLSNSETDAAVTHVIRTYGAKEDFIREKLGGLTVATNPSVTVLKDENEILVRVSARGKNSREAAVVCAPVLKEAARRLGDLAYGLDVPSIQAAVVQKLNKKELGVAIAEAGTGGMLTRIIGETEGGPGALRYSTAADSDNSKITKLSVSPRLLKRKGGVSEYAAVAMADGARKRAGCDIGVGLAANSDDLGDKHAEPGTVFIAVCDSQNVYVKKLMVGAGDANADVIIDAAISRALNMIRLFVDYLPEPYKGCIPLAAALAGKTVTDRDSYDDDCGEFRKRGSFLDLFIIRKADEPKVKVRKAIFILAVLVFAGCAGYLTYYYYGSFTAGKQHQHIQSLYEEAPVHAETVDEHFPVHYHQDFGPLWTVNSDTVGYIFVEGTGVGYPVVQADDNEFYHRRDFYQEPSRHGVPYMDYRVDIGRPSDNLVIYGHNMEDGRVFGELANYTSLDYLLEHPVISFNTLYEDNGYIIFGVFFANAREDQGPVFAYHDFINAASARDFNSYVDEIKLRSVLDTGVDVRAGDILMTLSTCASEFEDARFVIAARRLRDGEEPSKLLEGAKVNPDPLYPDIWYEKFGGERPGGAGNATVVTTPTAARPFPSLSDIERQAASPQGFAFASSARSLSVTGMAGMASELAEAQRLKLEEAEEEAQRLAEEESELEDRKQREKAAAEALIKQQEAEVATVANNVAIAAKDAGLFADEAERASTSKQAEAERNKARSAANYAKTHSDIATELAAKVGTERAAELAENAKASAAAAAKAFDRAEAAMLRLVEAERAAVAREAAAKEAAEKQAAAQQAAARAAALREAAAKQAAVGEAASNNQGNNGHSNSQPVDIKDPGKITVTANGTRVSASTFEIVSRIVQNEVGSGFHEEAIKAQAVAAYSYLLYEIQGGRTPSVYMSSTASKKVEDAVSKVLGVALTFNGKVAFTPYYATSAGVTTSSQTVWGGHYSYLVSVDSSVDMKHSSYQVTTKMSRSEVQKRISSRLGIDASGDPSGWFEVLTYNDGIYNGNMEVCGYNRSSSGESITGRLLRETVLNLRSAAFDIDYDRSGETFIFTTYGYGHGVGMSQNGANLYASTEGWSYVDILMHYYPGIRLG